MGKFKVWLNGAGDMELEGRPDFLSRADAIEVNRDLAMGEMEDRRHIIHWDEQLKPVLDSVWSSIKTLPEAEQVPVLRAPLQARRLQRLPMTRTGLWQRAANELNSAPRNLAAGRADINQAIEKVRARLRRVMARLGHDAELAPLLAAARAQPQPNHAAMEVYRTMAIAELMGPSASKIRKKGGKAAKVDDDGPSPVKSQILAIGFQIVEFLEGCESPAELVDLLHDVIDSVTFDLSEKTRREQTQATLAWLRMMQANIGRPPAERYEAMLTLID